MDAVLRNFKTIPCPAGDACKTKGCQWQHSWDTETSSGGRGDGPNDALPHKPEVAAHSPWGTATVPRAFKGSVVSSTPLKRKADEPAPAPGLPRKTPKIQSALGTPGKATSSESVALSDPKPHGTPPTRNPPSANNLRAGIPSSPSKVAGTTKPSPSTKPVRKAESLNPRHLASSPATHEFRHKVLKLLHDQFVRLNEEAKKAAGKDQEKLRATVRSPQQLIWLALDEEERAATDRPSIYSNVIRNRVVEHKKMGAEAWMAEREREYLARKEQQSGDKKSITASKTTTGEARSLDKTMAPTHSTPQLGPPVVVKTGLTQDQELEVLKRMMITPASEHPKLGYVTSVPTKEEVAAARLGQEAAKGYEECDRCKSRFQVFPGRREEDGALASGGKCTHHPGKAYVPEKAPGERGMVPKRWRCCGEAAGDSAGCQQGSTHVFKFTSPARLASVLPFVETPANPNAALGRAVAFDCEMGYTVYGMELIRLTATSWPDGALLVDVLVRPLGEILDLNSRYSGVWPEDIVNAQPYKADSAYGKTADVAHSKAASASAQLSRGLRIVPSPAAARDLLFSYIAPSTPLIGHGLENDLNAVRIVHPTLVDTVTLFPHPRGLPMRFGLKVLMERHLNKRIQVDTDASGKPVLGHDSAEDARAAGELVLLAVANKWDGMRREGWTLVNSQLVPPNMRV
ncbi:hypothetical protein GQ53DRAFT_745719 [Thozetella sp. PMI_491]|nr:hypothetical protein GQ53DRAFT_745719 [Thozetella sp. PMI_491]